MKRRDFIRVSSAAGIMGQQLQLVPGMEGDELTRVPRPRQQVAQPRGGDDRVGVQGEQDDTDQVEVLGQPVAPTGPVAPAGPVAPVGPSIPCGP